MNALPQEALAKQVRATACKPASFPTIGNFFSNRWKNREIFFQSLENRRKIFPIVGKTDGGADGMASAAFNAGIDQELAEWEGMP